MDGLRLRGVAVLPLAVLTESVTHQLEKKLELTGTPPESVTSKDVRTFLALYGLTGQPVYVDYDGSDGYEPNHCHISVKHVALTKKGKRIHGWALWQFEGFVLGEFHSIWENPAGEWIDVTPPKWGADKVLFVADPTLSIYDHGEVQALYCDRSSIEGHRYWFQGTPMTEEEWAIPNDHPELKRYCDKLGLPNTSMV